MVSVEVLDQPAQLLVEVDDLDGARAQDGVTEQADGLDGHEAPHGLCFKSTESARLSRPRPGRATTRTVSVGLAGAADGRRRLEGGGELGTVLTGHPDQRSLPRPLTLPTLGRRRAARAPRRRRAARCGPAGRRWLTRAGDRGHAHGRREPQRRTVGKLAPGVPGRVPPHERLHRRQRGVGHDHDLTALAARPGQRSSEQPPPQGLLPRPQVGPAEQRPGVEQEYGSVAAVGHRLGARGGDDQRRPPPRRWRAPRRGPRCGRRHRETPGPARRRCAARRPPRPAGGACRRLRRSSPPTVARTTRRTGSPGRSPGSAGRRRSRSGPRPGSRHRRAWAGSRAWAPGRAPADPLRARREPPARRRSAAAPPGPRGPGRGRRPPPPATTRGAAARTAARGSASGAAQRDSTQQRRLGGHGVTADEQRRAG